MANLLYEGFNFSFLADWLNRIKLKENLLHFEMHLALRFLSNEIIWYSYFSNNQVSMEKDILFHEESYAFAIADQK